MPVEPGDTVTVEYVGRTKDGTVFDTSDRALAQQEGLLDEESDRVYQPLEIDLGDDAVIPGLEDALVGLETGEQTRLAVPPERAYGDPVEERFGEYDRGAFENMLGEHELEEGFEVEAKNGLTGRVTDIGPESVTVDFNHELAGETLVFDVEVVAVE